MVDGGDVTRCGIYNIEAMDVEKKVVGW